MKKILLVEDNLSIIMGLEYTLKQENFEVTTMKTKEEVSKIEDYQAFDLAILDITLPDGNGFDICRDIKAKSQTPVIFLTAKDEEDDVVCGLDLGADDYIIKPFRNKELVSRINRILKRNRDNKKIVYKNITLDTEGAIVYKDDQEVLLTALEYRILYLLFTNIGKMVTREEILERIWDVAGNYVNDNTLTVYIKRLRSKIGEDIITTVKGLGYRI